MRLEDVIFYCYAACFRLSLDVDMASFVNRGVALLAMAAQYLGLVFNFIQLPSRVVPKPEFSSPFVHIFRTVAV